MLTIQELNRRASNHVVTLRSRQRRLGLHVFRFCPSETAERGKLSKKDYERNAGKCVHDKKKKKHFLNIAHVQYRGNIILGTCLHAGQ